MNVKKLITIGLLFYILIITGSYFIYQYYIKNQITTLIVPNSAEGLFSNAVETEIKPKHKDNDSKMDKYVMIYEYIFTIVTNSVVYYEYDSILSGNIEEYQDDKVVMAMVPYWRTNQDKIIKEYSTEIKNSCLELRNELGTDLIKEIYKSDTIEILNCDLMSDFTSDRHQVAIQLGVTLLDEYLSQQGYSNDKLSSQIYHEVTQAFDKDQDAAIYNWMRQSDSLTFTREKLKIEIIESDLKSLEDLKGDIDKAEDRLLQIKPTNINDIKLIAMMQKAIGVQKNTIYELDQSVDLESDDMYLHSTIQSEKAGYLMSMILSGQFLTEP